MAEIGLALALFTAVVMSLALIVLAARARLRAQGTLSVRVNEERVVRVPAGANLQLALDGAGIHLPSACGGKGTCGLCRVTVRDGEAGILPVERALIGRRDAADGVRLACQVAVKGDLEVTVPSEVLGARRLLCSVRSSRFLSPMIKELDLALPAGETLAFEAGAFLQLTAPPFCLRLADIPLPETARAEWARLGLLERTARSDRPQTRAYSLANYATEGAGVLLNVRLAVPPPGAPAEAPPGTVSSYLFGLQPGDEVEIAGAFGDFRVHDADRELVFIGGGAGMAPLRAQILEQLLVHGNERKITYWYGARSLADAFYVDLFERLAATHANFEWHLALSEPRPEDDWTGPTGFIHEVLRDQYLARHEQPETCGYYVCGPPVMLAAVRRMLDDLGVEASHIHCDDFGG